MQYSTKKKTRVDVLDLMAFFNIDLVIRGEEAQYRCPFHQDRDPSSSINLITSQWTCYRCKIGGNAIAFVSRLKDWDYKKADLWIRERYGGFFKPASLLAEVNRFLSETEDYYYPEEILDAFKINTDYWENRGIGKELQKKFELGYDSETERVTIPIRAENKKLVGVQARATTKKGEAYGKYNFLYDMPKKRYLFGLHLIDHSNMVVVVESALAAIRLNGFGFPTVSTMGSVVSEEQAEQLNSFNRVYMLYDNDESGWLGMIGPSPREKKHSRLASWKKIKTKVYIPTDEDYDDLDMLLKDEIDLILKTSRNAHVWAPILMSEKMND